MLNPFVRKHPNCPKHDTYMVPYPFDAEIALPNGIEVLRCPNLSCSMLYAKGKLEGFYTRSPNGQLTPYQKPV
jgi:hypothetical protein